MFVRPSYIENRPRQTACTNLWRGTCVPLYSFYKAWSDREERALFQRIVKPGMTVLDVGANIEIYTHFSRAWLGQTARSSRSSRGATQLCAV